MCIATLPTHPQHNHQAGGTSETITPARFCLDSWTDPREPPYPMQCLPGEGLSYTDAYVQRDYCDSVMTGIKVTKEQGLGDVDVYVRSLGAEIRVGMRCNSGWRP
jgi:hypothetical protein